jgi:predicted CoA-binding protein
MNTTETISQILEYQNWAIVGLANNPDRPAFGVAKLLQDKGHQIFPVHPKAETVHGAVGYSSLSEIPNQIDVVDCFVNSTLVGDVVDQAIAIGAKAVWLQLGVIDEAAAARAQAAGLLTVMDRCPAIEYQRLS